MADSTESIFDTREFGELVSQGKAAYKQGRFLDSMQFWRKAQAVDPSRRKELDGYLAQASKRQIGVHLKNAKTLEMSGDEEGAYQEFRRVLALEPQDEKLKQDVMDRVEAYESQANALSSTLLISCAAGYLALVAIAVWLITMMD